MGAKIIAVYNMKGGCAKSMTSMQLGGAFGLRGYRTMVVDMDAQATALTWSSLATEAEPFPAWVISLSGAKDQMIKEIKKFILEMDIILIDCPPSIDSSVPWAALQMADLGIIPVIPDVDNVRTSKRACDMGLRAKEENPDLQLAYLVSNARRGKLFETCLEQLSVNPLIPILNSRLNQRVAFQESQAFGQTVHWIGKKIPATLEVESLASEVLGLLKLKGKK